MNKYIFTCGDINGIGPEITVKTFNRIYNNSKGKIYFLCPADNFLQTLEIVKPAFQFNIIKKYSESNTSDINIIDIGKFKQKYGAPTKDSGRAAFKAIDLSYRLAAINNAAIITAPISKTAINLAGFNFPGHTEMYAEWCGVKNFVMMFLSKKMNAALITIHVPIKSIPKLLTKQRLDASFSIVMNTLQNELKIKNPKVAVLGLNPHAGEEGLIGKEEIEVISPSINLNQYKGNLQGPFTPDGFFGNKEFKNYDAIIGMYHDQVLIPFKLLNFDEGVNYTAGLPIVRTSPDHGTAFGISGKGIASENSMTEAFQYANRILNNRK